MFVNKQFEILLKKESDLLNSKRGKSVETFLFPLLVSKSLDEIFMAVNAAMFYDKSCSKSSRALGSASSVWGVKSMEAG